ncbi:thioredoxin domain-containing protein [Puniceicoccaceae bacterium K14]|nr:thioredoxin domain-containing protein [Puniceicoccaceae bacterium K14]
MNKRLFHKLLLPLALLTLLSLAKADEDRANVTGMYFYASWCAACKTLEPKLEEAKSLASDNSFELVRFDVSNKAKQNASKLLAAELNLESMYEKIGVKSGIVVLVDTQTGKEIGRIKRSDAPQAIAKKIANAEESLKI